MGSSRRHWLRGAMGLGIALVLAGCGGDRHPGSVERVPLTGDLMHAAFIAAYPILDLRAEPERAAPPPGLGIVLDKGWGPPEPFGRWVVGTHAIVTAFLPDDRPRRLMVECRRFPTDGAGAPQAIHVSLNGHEVGRTELQTGWRSLEWDLPDEALDDGANRIELDFSSAISPFDLGRGGDHRRLAAGVRRIALTPVASDLARTDSRPPSAADRVVVPIRPSAVGGRLELHMRTSPSGPDPLSLELLDLEGRSTRLEPEVEVREDGRWIVATLPPDPPRLDFLVIEGDHGGNNPSQLELVRRVTGGTSARTEARTTPHPSAAPPDVVVVIGDALRPDHLGFMGYSRDTSPFLDRLARESLAFPNAVATASYSLASVATILSGLSPFHHRVVQREDRLTDDVETIAEHGEAFGDHGWFGHSGTVYDEMVRVPFILRLPAGRDAGTVDTTQLVSLEDVLPTLLDVAGLPPPTKCDGVDLLAPSSKETRDARVVLMRNALDNRLDLGVRSLRWKAVIRGTEKRQLFDLSVDPREMHDLAGERRELLGGFEALLAASFTWGNHAGAPTLPDAEANALRALGYVDHS